MIGLKRDLIWGTMVLIILSAIVLIFSPSIQAQYWTALPPYNVLWPLWSPALSPPDPLTGVPTPLITSLTNSTLLPAQPGLVWDPLQVWPWAIYNVPTAFGGGLTYFDQRYGLNPWPPSYLLDPIIGGPAPLALPLTYSLLSPSSLEHFEYFLLLANSVFSFRYGVPVFNLLNTWDIWGELAL
jgi:hypothetical protein